jgi:hypothetical protein
MPDARVTSTHRIDDKSSRRDDRDVLIEQLAGEVATLREENLQLRCEQEITWDVMRETFELDIALRIECRRLRERLDHVLSESKLLRLAQRGDRSRTTAV